MKKMLPRKKTIVCIFAHPDDESFGPGGTIALLAKENKVFIICITDGDAGQHTIVSKNRLGEVRKKELQKSSQILGVQNVFFLRYQDGNLCNNLYHEIAEKIKKKLGELYPDMLLTFEPRGVSGHIDHVFVSMVTSFVFKQLTSINELWYYCNGEKFRELMKDYFIYFPPGYKETEIDITVDTASVWNIKVKAMRMHASQKEDVEKVLSKQMKVPREEYFLVLKKPSGL